MSLNECIIIESDIHLQSFKLLNESYDTFTVKTSGDENHSLKIWDIIKKGIKYILAQIKKFVARIIDFIQHSFINDIGTILKVPILMTIDNGVAEIPRFKVMSRLQTIQTHYTLMAHPHATHDLFPTNSELGRIVKAITKGNIKDAIYIIDAYVEHEYLRSNSEMPDIYDVSLLTEQFLTKRLWRAIGGYIKDPYEEIKQMANGDKKLIKRRFEHSVKHDEKEITRLDRDMLYFIMLEMLRVRNGISQIKIEKAELERLYSSFELKSDRLIKNIKKKDEITEEDKKDIKALNYLWTVLNNIFTAYIKSINVVTIYDKEYYSYLKGIVNFFYSHLKDKAEYGTEEALEYLIKEGWDFTFLDKIEVDISNLIKKFGIKITK